MLRLMPAASKECERNYSDYQVLCRPTGGGPRLDHRARLQFGRAHFGVFSTSRFVPSALSSDFFTTMYFSPTLLRFSLTFHLLFRTFDVLFQYFIPLFPYFFITFSVLFFLFPPIICKNKIYIKKISKIQKKNYWHVQFKENIFLLQCLNK